MHQLVKILLIKSCRWRYMCLNRISVLESYLKIHQCIRSQYLRPSTSWPSISLNGIRCFSYCHAQFEVTVPGWKGGRGTIVRWIWMLSLSMQIWWDVTLGSPLCQKWLHLKILADISISPTVRFDSGYLRNHLRIMSCTIFDTNSKIYMRILKAWERVVQHGCICL